jgi:Na+/alanine symporter
MNNKQIIKGTQVLSLAMLIVWGCLKFGYGMHWTDLLVAGGMLLFGITLNISTMVKKEENVKFSSPSKILTYLMSTILVVLSAMLLTGYIIFGSYHL